MFILISTHSSVHLTVSLFGATTFSIMTLSIMILSKKTLGITTFNIETLSLRGLYVTPSISGSQ